MIAEIALFLQAAREELDLDVYRRPRAALVADYERACTGGVTLACDGARAPLRLDVVGPSASATCSHEDTAACVVAGWWERADGNGDPVALRRTQRALTRACSLDPTEGCAALARWEIGQPSLVEAGVNHAVDACDEGSAYGCAIAGLQARGAPLALPRLRTACEGGRLDACVAVSRVTRAPATSDPAVRAACDAGFEPACLDLGSTPAASLEGWCTAADEEACFARAQVDPELPLLWALRGCLASNVCAPFAEALTGPVDLGPYEAACGGGQVLACDVVALGHPEGEDPEAAVAELDALCAKGDGAACAFVADYTEIGWGLPQDVPRAATQRAMACAAGVAYGCPAHAPPRTPPWRQLVGSFPRRPSPSEAALIPWRDLTMMVRPEPHTPESVSRGAAAIHAYEVACATRIEADERGAYSSVEWVQCPVFLRATVRAALARARWQPRDPPAASRFDFRFVFRVH